MSPCSALSAAIAIREEKRAFPRSFPDARTIDIIATASGASSNRAEETDSSDEEWEDGAKARASAAC
jgi:hypothetical protein